MRTTPKHDLTLKLGNLVLAIWLATVPTAITYGALGLHGLNICSSLESKLSASTELNFKESCHEASWQTTKSYIFLIGFFITLPTWMWFYLSVRKKNMDRS